MEALHDKQFKIQNVTDSKPMNPKKDYTSPSKEQVPQQALLNRITNRIRESLELTEILSATVAEVRAYLGTDRVKIYQFMPDNHGWVIAEAINANKLPSLHGLHFPADDIPSYSREVYLREHQRTIVDLEQQAIGVSHPHDYFSYNDENENEIAYRPIDPCHLEYLLAMGVKSSVVVPIILDNATPTPQSEKVTENTERLWGLLVSHHATSRKVTPEEISFIQSVVDQVSVAISQSVLLEQVRAQARREADVNRVTTVLYTDATVQLQQALEETIEVYKGAGGRIYLFGLEDHLPPTLYTCGQQPTPLPGAPHRPMEEHALWQKYLFSTLPPEPTSECETDTSWSIPWMRTMYDISSGSTKEAHLPHIWAIADIYKEPLFRSLVPRFQDTDIRGALICPLQYGGHLVGCLSIFRNEIDQEIVWAGYHTPDERQLTPRQSFDAWRQLSKGQAQEWSVDEIRLINSLAERFSAAMKQTQLNQQIQSLNENLARQVEVRTEELAQSTMLVNQQRTLADILAKLQKPLDVKTLFKTATKEVQQLLKVDRVAVYRFDKDWGGEFIDEFGTVSSGWSKLILATRKVWNDSFLQDTAGGKYQRRELSVVHDIYDAGLTPCHIEVLEHYYVRSYIIVPVFLGPKLWGLLSVYQHENPRRWDESEVSFMAQLATHLGVALQQGQSIEKVQAQTDELAVIAEQQRTMNAVITRIRESLDLKTIFKTTTYELRQLLNVERVLIYRFIPSSNFHRGEVLAENVRIDHLSLLDHSIQDRCFKTDYKKRPNQGEVYAINDVEGSDLSDCYRNMLRSLEIKANLVAPLFNGANLWGLLCLHNCSGPRNWNNKEKEFAAQIASQLGVAIQQAQLLSDTEKARMTADAANQAKSRFLATMSHELRTPLNAILGMVQLFNRDTDLTEKQAQRLSTIGKSGEHLLSLINDVLQMSRIEAGQVSLEEKVIWLPHFLTMLGDMLENSAESKGLVLTLDLADNLPDYICIDDSKLRQILINLLGNALKFTQQGEVKLLVYLADDAEQAATSMQINFSVQDTGPGISEQDQELIFDAFGQSDIGSRSNEGTGLGLTICRQFVDLMGGEISVKSQVGVGSAFRFSIQVKQVSRSEYESLTPTQKIIGLEANQPSPKALVVEDKETNRLLVSELLKSIGITVKEAVNGKEAIAMWQDWQPHLILMDVRMPVMDGYEATHKIRDLAQDSAPIIIALTANAFEEDRQEALKAGCDDFVQKPYDEQHLLKVIGQHLGLRYRYINKDDKSSIDQDRSNPDQVGAGIGEANGNTTEQTAKITPLNILIADDDLHTQDFMEELLTQLGHQVTLVSDGKAALEAATQQHYDMLMCDVHMPKLTGIEATRLIRQHDTASQLLIVGVTGSSVSEELEACYQAGIDKILSKPVKFQAIESLLSSFPKLRKAREKVHKSESNKFENNTSNNIQDLEKSDSNSTIENIPGLDSLEPSDIKLTPAILDRQYFFDSYHEAYGENAPKKIVAKVQAFLSELPDRLANLQTLMNTADHEQVFFISHTLKVLVKTYGATELTEIFEAIEEEARHTSSSNYQYLLERLEVQCERFKLALSLELDRYNNQTVQI